jgi:hypothetical protein
MRGVIVLVFVMLAPAAAQVTVISPTGTACTNPAAPAAAPQPAMPSVAAGTVAARNRDFGLALANFKPLAEIG